MSDNAETQGHGHEIFIVKRHGGGHDEHHGGVWKIAFADFMTAMMAFFLVMWLISANDKTKATIAKYFNPIELVDSTPQPPGLNDSKKDPPNVERKSEVPGPDAKGSDPKPADKGAAAPQAAAPRAVDMPTIDEADQSARHDEMELLRDPYAVLAEIAEKKSTEPPKQTAPLPQAKSSEGSGAVGLKAGDAYRDPFEPQPLPAGQAGLLAEPTLTLPPAPPTPTVERPPASAADMTAGPLPSAPPAGPAPAAPTMSTTGSAAAAKDGADGVAPAAIDHGDDKPLSATALRVRLAALAKSADTASGSPGPKLDVRRTDEGTLISLTDSSQFSMFASASARPSPETVVLMEKIGRLLKAQKGGIVIRGYTDSRRFHSETYDNWRLSTERAHIAQYMLARGGLDDTRIDRIEGYADRHPKNAKDPEGAENRRIEILVRDTTP